MTNGHMAVAEKMYQNGTLVNGTKDKNLRNASSSSGPPFNPLKVKVVAGQGLDVVVVSRVEVFRGGSIGSDRSARSGWFGAADNTWAF